MSSHTESRPSFQTYLYSVFIIFFVSGLIVSFNGIVVPYLKILFKLNYAEVMLIDFAFNITFLVCSYPAGILFERKGYTFTLNCGLLVFATGCLVMFPAIQYFNYPLVLAGIFILGIGFNLVLVAGSPFIAALGKPETASSRVTFGQALMATGQTLAPLLGTLYLLRGSLDNTEQMGSSFQKVYLSFAGVLFIVWVFTTRMRSFHLKEKTQHEIINSGAIWMNRHLVLGVLGIFIYIGIEAYISSVFILFVGSKSIGNMTHADAGAYLTLFWAGFTVARFAGAAILKKVPPQQCLRIAAGIAILLMFGVVFLEGYIVVILLLITGMCCSVMFPSIYALGIRGLGNLEGKGSGLMFMAMCGAAIIPYLQGVIADATNVQYSFLVSLASFGYILFYAISGYRIRADMK